MKRLPVLLSLLVLFFLCPNTRACSGFIVKKDSLVLVGKNNDLFNPNTRMWFVPAEKNCYGRVCFGADDNYPISALNDRGLVMDHFAGSRQEILKSRNKPVFAGNLFEHVLSTCATVPEVLDTLNLYSLGMFHNGMVMFCDRQGRSAIVEGDTVVFKAGAFQICTNFYQSEFPKNQYPCWRYNQVRQMLTANDFSPTPESCRDVLTAVQQEITQFSVVYDLQKLKIYVYYFQDFENVQVFSLKKELEKGAHAFNLPELFPGNKKFGRTNYGKLVPQRNFWIAAFLVLAGLFYLFSLIVLAAEYFTSTTFKNRLNLFTRLAAMMISFLGLIYLLALAKFPQLFYIGLPERLHGRIWVEKVLLHLPLVCCAILPVLLVFVVLVWRKLESVLLKWCYVLLVFLTMVLLAFYSYWGFFKIYV